MRLEQQKKDAEAIVHNVMLGDTRLGPEPTRNEDTCMFLDVWTREANLNDLYETILRITLDQSV